MASHPSSNDNPWQNEASQQPARNQYQSHGTSNPNPYSTYQDQTQPQNSFAQDSHQNPYTQDPRQAPYQPPNHPPPLSSNPPDQPRYYQDSTYTSHQDTNVNTNTTNDIPPSLPPRRTGTDLALPTGQDRSHQIEVMQSYEAAGRKDEDDQNVEVLQREFPRIDGSLIAAIYGDSKSLSATREMLGELDVE